MSGYNFVKVPIFPLFLKNLSYGPYLEPAREVLTSYACIHTCIREEYTVSHLDIKSCRYFLVNKILKNISLFTHFPFHLFSANSYVSDY